jgi:hypothetical protein
MIKKSLFPILFILLVLALTACGSNVKISETNQPDSTNQRTMPLEMQLMLGTVKLDETGFAIDSQQASELLPLWKALRSLASSDTAAQAEVDALINQIHDTMTADQLNTIETMGLSMQDMAGVAETLGVEFGSGGRFGEISPEMQATMEAMRQSGQFPGGGEFPEGRQGGGFIIGGGQGPGGGFGGAGMDPSVRETAIAERGGSLGQGFGINTQLLEAIITFLEAKTQ